MEAGFLVGELGEERTVEIGEAILPVEVLVGEARNAEREVPPGESGRCRDFQGAELYSDEPDAEKGDERERSARPERRRLTALPDR